MGVKNLRYLTKILMITVCLVALSGITAAYDQCGDNECTSKSPGYWKNHPEAWPVEEITIGGVQYSKDSAIAEMQKPVKGDKTYTMFDALIAAKLNRIKGCCLSGDIINKINEGDLWMSENYYGPVGTNVKADSPAWQQRTKISSGCEIPSGEAIYLKLDAYNNGYYC